MFNIYVGRMTMKYTTGLLLCLSLAMPADATVWQDEPASLSEKSHLTAVSRTQIPYLSRARQLQFDSSALRFKLAAAPSEAAEVSTTTLDLPLPNGGVATFAITNSPILAPSLARKNLNIQTFRAVDIANPSNTGRFDITPAGFHAVFDYGGKTVFIDPIGETGRYQSYYKKDYAQHVKTSGHSPVACLSERLTVQSAQNQTRRKASTNQTNFADDVSFGTTVRTYRLAVAATGEYTAFHGGTRESALAAIVTAVNRINQVFERDLAVKMELVPNNIDVIYTDAATDPYTDNDALALIDEAQADIDAKIGTENYDIGHVFSTAAGGIAGLGVVCRDSKAQGATGRPDPINDPFLIDLVAHEIGHQFGAEHTFNGTARACGSDRSAVAAYAPGSGTTIMGYAGLCADEDIQLTADDYFHTHSIAQMSEYVSAGGTGATCGSTATLSNAVPNVEAGASGNIPVSTPFELRGTATDADAGDTLSYVWEQYDLGAPTSSQANFTDDGTRPLFRSFPPTASATRTFPQISDILGETTTYGEILPTTTRDLTFRFTVRDQNGGVASDTRTLAVSSDAGPFTMAALSDTELTGLESLALSWDVANTDAAPISCADVKVDLSTDGGQSFGTAITASTPNDGSASVSVPNVDTTTGRIRIACATQPFFTINDSNFSISSVEPPAPPPNAEPVASADSFTVDQDSGTTSFDVLENDTDSDGDTLTVESVGNFSNGGSAVIAGANVNYTPAAGVSGTETFDYVVSDGNGGTATGTVTVTIVAPPPPPNAAPTAVDDAITVDQDSAATLIAVLSNDSDSDGDTLSISNVSTPNEGGSAQISGTQISYQPATGFSGTETFTYEVSDGNDGTSAATVTVTVTAAPPPPPTPAPTPAPTPSSSGGGGSFGIFLLMLLGLAGMMKTSRVRRDFSLTKRG